MVHLVFANSLGGIQASTPRFAPALVLLRGVRSLCQPVTNGCTGVVDDLSRVRPYATMNETFDDDGCTGMVFFMLRSGEITLSIWCPVPAGWLMMC